jgi:hypothetical protein
LAGLHGWGIGPSAQDHAAQNNVYILIKTSHKLCYVKFCIAIIITSFKDDKLNRSKMYVKGFGGIAGK